MPDLCHVQGRYTAPQEESRLAPVTDRKQFVSFLILSKPRKAKMSASLY